MQKTEINFYLLVANADHKSTSCLIVVIMTHGLENGVLEAFDTPFQLEDVLKLFRFDQNQNVTLLGKPKLFFIQACRGSTHDPGTKCQNDAGRCDIRALSIPSSADQLVMYATSEGYVAVREFVKGSWFIQELCTQLANNKTEDLLSILTTVVRKVALQSGNVKHPITRKIIYTKQAATIVSSLTKKVYFL